MKKGLPILLIVAGIGLGIFGFMRLNDSGGSLEIGDLEISAQDQGQKNSAYILLGGGALCLLAGVRLYSKK
ncbi:MAG: hypothetical protein KDC44_25245 [Phaeodactylibacter sp.]|nr:hypothetical protein [Phaeodactylibacter sp.]